MELIGGLSVPEVPGRNIAAVSMSNSLDGILVCLLGIPALGIDFWACSRTTLCHGHMHLGVVWATPILVANVGIVSAVPRKSLWSMDSASRFPSLSSLPSYVHV